ncbi:MAG TPA: pyridoxine 5'-phosphate synthase [Bacteroidia bacterium]|nr:pyridoxine 5'-phosphate synthase [Bacteroidia bacterium]
MTKLSVNVNKIATLRNARGGNIPDVIKVASDCERFGADGITVHPRPDERHIRFRDVYDLKKMVTTEFNIEGYPNKKFLELVKEIKPGQVTLVPDPPGVITSNAGWDTVKNKSFLKDIIAELKSFGMRISVFIDPDLKMIENAPGTGTDRIELYTEAYAKNFYDDPSTAIAPYIKAAQKASELNLGINAGHDLNLDNLDYFFKNIPGLLEVSIGHALICDALYFGLENTVQLYKRKLL